MMNWKLTRKAKLLFIIPCLVLIVLPVYLAGYSFAQLAPSPKTGNTPIVNQATIPMPEGFTDIRLQMLLKEFMSIRTQVVHSSAMDSGPIKGTGSFSLISLTEKAAHPFFSRGQYYFVGSRLHSVSWLTFYGKDVLHDKTKQFLPYVIELYGKPSLLRLATDGSPRRKTELLWHKRWQGRDVLIRASFTPEARFYRPREGFPRADRGYVQLGIFTGDLAKSLRQPTVMNPSQTEINKYLVPVRDEIAKLLPGGTSKVRLDTLPHTDRRKPQATKPQRAYIRVSPGTGGVGRGKVEVLPGPDKR